MKIRSMKIRPVEIRSIAGDARGLSIVEFALFAPIFIGMIIAAAQLSLVFFANAGIKNAVGEGARLASLYPRPTNAQIAARITARRLGVDPAYLTGPTFVEGLSGGANYLDITMTYSAPVDFLFYEVGPIKLTHTRRVYTHSAS